MASLEWRVWSGEFGVVSLEWGVWSGNFVVASLDWRVWSGKCGGARDTIPPPMHTGS